MLIYSLPDVGLEFLIATRVACENSWEHDCIAVMKKTRIRREEQKVS